MKIKLSFSILLTIIFLNIETISSQNIWRKIKKINYIVQKKEIYQKKNFPSQYEILSLDLKTFSNKLKKSTFNQKEIIFLPNFDGSLSRFQIKEASNFEAKLKAKFPNIKSYSAQGIDDLTAVAKISIGTDGFHAVIFSGTQATVYIDPYSRDNKDYIVYKRTSLSTLEEDFKCEVETATEKEFSVSDFSKNVNDGKLRTFRLALVCSGEYTQFHLGATQQNIPDSATDLVKKAAVLSAMNTTITRLNGVFEKDLSIKLVLVNDNEQVIFLDADTDGITDGNASTMFNEVQSICDTKIGDANYDIGHIFSTGGSGLAGLGVVCVTGSKARGVTGRSQPVGDPFDIDFVAHEMGHQFGANHTQNNDCNRNISTAVEPGSASTIMGYAGICSPNVQAGNANGNSDDYFHAVSIAEMWATIQSSANCGSLTETTNTAPVADAGLDYSIPKSTPFVLRGTATDEDGLSSLTYNWEQLDNEVATMPPLSTNTAGPMFRSLPSKISPVRYMPDIGTVILGSTASTWEVVPSVTRELNFSFLVRDNHSGGGSTARDDMKVEVVNSAAFLVTSQSTEETYNSGQTISVTWNKGATDVAPIDCQNVNIKLSIDGGVTFPIFLKTNTPNDGTEEILIPNNSTTNARIMVEASDNIFYNVNTSNFIINSIIPTFLMTTEIDHKAVCNSGNKTVDYILNFNFINGFTDTVILSASGIPAGANVVFNPQTINDDGNVTMTLSNLDGETAQDYAILVIASSASVNQQIEVYLNVVSNDFNKITLISPENNSSDFELAGNLSWYADSNSESYNIQVSLDNDFTDLVFSENVIANNVRITTSLNQETTYFWRVQPVNSCNTGVFNDPFSFTTLSCDVCEGFGSTEFETSTTLVKFNTIDNASEKEDNNQGYSDFKSLETEVVINESYELSVNVNTDGAYRVQTKVWIDWNKDCLFDLTEEYDLGSAEDGIDISTSLSPFLIAVPENAKVGTTTLRVSTKYTALDDVLFPISCEINFDGEVEDYSLVVKKASIKDAVFDEFNLFPNPSDGTFNLSFATKEKNDVSVQLFDLAGRLVDSKYFNNSSTYFTRDISFNVKSGGLYLLKITNNNKYTTRKLIIK
tara:strand:- start:7191 stop:10499 length:3309 start_codon:yes stop_codon:yes gene_type:complete